MTVHSLQLHERYSDNMIVSAAMSQIAGGLGAIVLAVIGLLHYAPMNMAAVTSIVLGAAFALNSGLLATERARVMNRTFSTALDAVEFNGGVSIEAVAGVGAVVLGILSLLEVDAIELMPVCALVLAIGLILSSGILAQVNSAVDARGETATFDKVTHGTVVIATALQILAGVGAIVLGILALAGFSAAALSLIAFLALGSASVVSGAAVSSRMVGGRVLKATSA